MMEDSTALSAPIAERCYACSAEVVNDDVFCVKCGYPLQGTEQEQRYFLAGREAKEIDLSAANKKIRRASIALYVVAGLTAVFGVALAAMNKNPDARNSLIITNLILAAIYGGLGFWCNRKPLAAIIAGSALYALILILNAIINPLTIVSGIIFKIVIIGFFVRGIKAAIEAEKLKKELNAE
jgi:hypothetical protein